LRARRRRYSPPSANTSRDLHDGLVRNLRKVGLLTERIAPNLQSFGISLAAA
jgi:hypothetical protein